MADPFRHLLSHRLRGFSPHEGSLSALRAALARGVRYLEIDTRLTADGEILVYHDTNLDKLTCQRGPVARHDVARRGCPRFRGSPEEDVPTLEEFVDVFARSDSPGELLVDIKDFGAERRHCEIIEAAGITERAWVISWSPEVLLRVHEMLPRLRLSFSYLPLTRLRAPLRALARALGTGGPIRSFGHLGSMMGMRNNLSGVTLHFDDYEPKHPSDDEIKGTFPIHVLSDLPTGRLGEILAASRGSVGISSLFLTRDYVERAHRLGLEVFVFTLNTPRAVRRALASCGPDVIFTDEARMFSVDWTKYEL